ncbi:DsbE family thiol:disulfide interchange protein [Candidatus Thioglobus sp.]|jgi:periplasmic protein thiol:disulfide oxidoreductases, DsbE subfamily|uniref:DsbE family thiol:disulfide interchange protein n=1 Tax=Candidatus Thioglobus sp. TaxID=2026721 RepID=UPI00175AF11D|nr:DsbE family thiol:disulfide interchange protein [Candidatus Thioglobus sp.]
MKKFIPLILFVVLVGFLYVGLSLDPKKLPSPLIGKPFPSLEVRDFHTGEKFLIKERLKGKVSVVNGWASWCATCRVEHKMLMNISKKKVVQMVGVNYKDTKKEGSQFLEILGNPFEFIIFDNLGELGLELGIYAMPETFIVDKQGVIRFKRIGEVTQKIWDKEMLPLIKELKI